MTSVTATAGTVAGTEAVVVAVIVIVVRKQKRDVCKPSLLQMSSLSKERSMRERSALVSK